jgi:hypothetical protein
VNLHDAPDRTPDQPIGSPAFRDRTDERHFTGPQGWSLPQRAAELAPLLGVKVVRIGRAQRRLGTRERVTIRVQGRPRELARYWRRVEEIVDVTQRSGPPMGRWSLRLLFEFLSPWN